MAFKQQRCVYWKDGGGVEVVKGVINHTAKLIFFRILTYEPILRIFHVGNRFIEILEYWFHSAINRTAT